MPMNENQTTKNAKRKRRFRLPSFGLRFLFVLILIAAGSLGYLIPKMEEAQREKESLDWMAAHVTPFAGQIGYQASFDFEFDETARAPYGPAIIRKLCGEFVFSRVKTIRIVTPSYTEPLASENEAIEFHKELFEAIETFDDLTGLEFYFLRSERNFKRLAKSSNLRTLSLKHIKWMTDISDISKLQKLEELELDGGSFQSVDAIGQLGQLKKLTIDHCLKIADASALANLTQLEHLQLSYNPSLEDFGFLAKLKNLKSLTLKTYKTYPRASEFDMSVLANCKKLQKLEILYFEEVKNPQTIKHLTSLVSLNLFGTHSLESLDGFESLSNLQELFLNENFILNDIEAIRELTGLRTLSLNGCFHLHDVEPIKNLNQLDLLRLGGSSEIADLRVIENLKMLEVLALKHFPALEDISALANLNLQRLTIELCPKVTSLKPLNQLPKLRKLVVEECEGLRNLDGIGATPNLEHIAFFDCRNLVDVNALKDLKNRKPAFYWPD